MDVIQIPKSAPYPLVHACMHAHALAHTHSHTQSAGGAEPAAGNFLELDLGW